MNVAKICIDDVEELSYTVNPWQFRMNQLSPGKLSAVMRVAQVGDIFVTEEYWSRKISGTGQTPTGYLTLAGPIDQEGFSWCGAQTNKQRLAYAHDCREVDFLARDREHHWTLLIPRKVILGYLSEEIMLDLPKEATSLEVDSRLVGQLSSIIVHVLALLGTQNAGQDRGIFEAQNRQRILAAMTRLLLNADHHQVDHGNSSKRLHAYRKARFYIEGLHRPISVTELAKHVGVCRRTLELGFREATGLPPKVFLQRARLNGLHRELRRSSSRSYSATRAAQKWGFTELGRTAGYYRELFGVSPSDTLKSDFEISGLRFSDVIQNFGDSLLNSPGRDLTP